MSDDIAIRPFSSQADYRACVELQYETWGREFKDAVPASILQVNQKIGGVSAGAFDGKGRLVGFVFGMTGVEDGRVVQWSDMLAVRPELRGKGLGRMLKEFQRQEAARVGCSVIYWTFDPLVARNAHFNFNILGARAVHYVRDMYGENTGSVLHRGIGTDRLIVAWDVADDALTARKLEVNSARKRFWNAAKLVGDAERRETRTKEWAKEGDMLALAVPADISALQEKDPDLAIKWRKETRAAFETAFEAGYVVSGFTTDKTPPRGYYLLSKPTTH